MLSSHELFGFMSPTLAQDILNHAYADDRELYKATLQAVAQVKHVRPAFLQQQSRVLRHKAMAETLARPVLELAAANMLRGWLLKQQTAVLVDFLDALGIPHENGAVEDLPAGMEDDKLKAAVEALLAKHPHEIVAVYLHAFNAMNAANWPNLNAMLETEGRLQLGA